MSARVCAGSGQQSDLSFIASICGVGPVVFALLGIGAWGSS